MPSRPRLPFTPAADFSAKARVADRQFGPGVVRSVDGKGGVIVDHDHGICAHYQAHELGGRLNPYSDPPLALERHPRQRLSPLAS